LIKSQIQGPSLLTFSSDFNSAFSQTCKMSTRTERFQRKSAENNDVPAKVPERDEEEAVKFSAEEEAVNHPTILLTCHAMRTKKLQTGTPQGIKHYEIRSKHQIRILRIHRSDRSLQYSDINMSQLPRLRSGCSTK